MAWAVSFSVFLKKDGYYSSGQFARMAGVTLRTIRYYDQHDILKPSLVSESGARFYTDTDFARLQQILLLKYLGFSLEDIREMTIEDPDSHFMLNALNVQLKLVQDRIEQMQLVEKTPPGLPNVILYYRENLSGVQWKV
jgi:DNA-binding transcriptional MerR regulator